MTACVTLPVTGNKEGPVHSVSKYSEDLKRHVFLNVKKRISHYYLYFIFHKYSYTATC